MSDLVTVEQDGHVLAIGINRPDKLNAFNLEVIDAFAQAYERLGEDPDIWCGLVFAHGPNFSAGLDLAEVGAAVAKEGPAALSGPYKYDPWGLWKPQVPKPVVVAMNGISYTLSIELALASDVVVAADDVRFRQLEISRGIMPFGGGTFRGPGQLGWGNAMRYLLTGEEFGAEYAQRIGLVQEVVPSGEHVARAMELAQLIARQAPLGVQYTLANARIARDAGEAAAADHIQQVLPEIQTSQDAIEGVKSFIERREAEFTGR